MGHVTVADAAVARSAPPAALRLRDVSKTFGGTRALDGVSLEIAKGEIHALVGQNGCGKSTLIKILSGYHAPDVGTELWIDGEPVDLDSIVLHERLRFVHQDLGLILQLSAVDNLALSRGFARTRIGGIDWAEQTRQTMELVHRFSPHLDVTVPLAEVTPIERVIVAIAAALQQWDGEHGVLVLDEPTSVLPPNEATRLLRLIHEVRDRGASVLYVSHRLDEIFEIADRVTVLRGGRVVGTADTAAMSPRTLATMMVGTDVKDSMRPEPSASRRPLIEVRDLQARYLRGITFDLHEGEVLGVAGLPGSGREELPYLLAGATKPVAGALRLGKQPDDWLDLSRDPVPRSPIVPAERGREGVIAQFTVAENLTLPILDRLRRRTALNDELEAECVRSWFDRLSVTAPGSDALITTLSGGNQQKIIMARCLAEAADLIFLCEPTAGVDVGTRVELYDLITAQAREGLGVLVASSDIGDLEAICTRVLVLRDGLLVGELRGEEIDQISLQAAMEGTA